MLLKHPEIYSIAADMIERGPEIYTCVAVREAARRVGTSDWSWSVAENFSDWGSAITKRYGDYWLPSSVGWTEDCFTHERDTKARRVRVNLLRALAQSGTPAAESILRAWCKEVVPYAV